jgi:hypothetical protein
MPESPERVNQMTIVCPRCSNECSTTDKACPKCNFSFLASTPVHPELDGRVHVDPLTKKKYTEAHVAAPSTLAVIGAGAFGGVIGLIVGGTLAVIGIVLSATGAGVICGLPLIIFGVIIVITGFMSGTTLPAYEGHCPHCGVINNRTQPTTFNCSVCKKGIRYQLMRFYQKD